MYVEFNSVTLFTVLYSRFLNCAKDVSKVIAQPTISEYVLLLATLSLPHTTMLVLQSLALNTLILKPALCSAIIWTELEIVNSY